jgi:hypothetical protein
MNLLFDRAQLLNPFPDARERRAEKSARRFVSTGFARKISSRREG